MLPLRARVDQGVMVIKEFSSFTEAPELQEAHHQIVLCHHIRTFVDGGGVLPLWRKADGVFNSPTGLSKLNLGILKRRLLKYHAELLSPSFFNLYLFMLRKVRNLDLLFIFAYKIDKNVSRYNNLTRKMI